MIAFVDTVLVWIGLIACASLVFALVCWLLIIPCLEAFTVLMRGVAACVGFFTDRRVE